MLNFLGVFALMVVFVFRSGGMIMPALPMVMVVVVAMRMRMWMVMVMLVVVMMVMRGRMEITAGAEKHPDGHANHEHAGCKLKIGLGLFGGKPAREMQSGKRQRPN